MMSTEGRQAFFAVSLVLYGAFLCTEGPRLQVQRGVIQRFRTEIGARLGAFNLPRAGQGYDDKPASIKARVCVWLFFHLLSFASLIFEGKWTMALGLSVLIGMMCTCLLTSQPRVVCDSLVRAIMLHQVCVMFNAAPMPSSGVVRRAVTVRTITSLLFIESLEECLLKLLVVTMILQFKLVDDNSSHSSLESTGGGSGGGAEAYAEAFALITLPLEMFVYAVLPMQLLGITDFLLMSIRPDDFNERTADKFLKSMRFFSCLISVYIIFVSYLHRAVETASPLVGVAFLLAGLALREPSLAKRINRWIAPNTLRLCKLCAGGGGGGSSPSSSSASSFFSAREAIFLTGLVVAQWALVWQLNSHALCVAATSLSAMLSLRETRQRIYSVLQSRLLMQFGAALVMAYGDVWSSSLLVFLAVFSSFLCVLSTCSREVIYSRIALENQAEAFLSHAIKQKFASVGAAVEQILVNKSYNPPLLHAVMGECRMGHARCFASGVFRKLEQGERRPATKRAFDSLFDQLKNTAMASTLITAATQLDETVPWSVELDWELVNLVMTDFARTGRSLKRVWCRCPMNGDDEMGEVCIELDQRLHRPNPILRRLLEELNGTVNMNVYVLRARVLPTLVATAAAASRESSVDAAAAAGSMATTAKTLAAAHYSSSSSSSSIASSPHTSHMHSPLAAAPRFQLARGGKHAVLSTLRFALVDDNALIRRNFERLMRQNLGVPESNILTLGSTYEESVRFPETICLANVDVAIFDQNLDFDQLPLRNGDHDNDDGGVLKGNELAERAKRLGFCGCLVLHSSDVQLGELLDESKVFHGAVEKSADSSRFVAGLEAAWRCYKEQQQ